jgi:hypothetical protein
MPYIMDLEKFNRVLCNCDFCLLRTWMLDGHWPRRFQINQSVIALHSRLVLRNIVRGKVVSSWRMNAISKWRYSLYGRGINIASVTSHEYITT